MDKKNFAKKNAERNNFGKKNNYQKPDRQKPAENDAALDNEREIICGRNPVIEALRSGAEINKVLLAEGMEPAKAAQIIELCRERKVVYASVPKQQLVKLAGEDNRGVIAYLAPFAYAEPEEMLALAAERNEPPFIVLLDGVEDPHNLGAIIRTALCTGAHGVIIPKRRSAALTQTVNKVSSGALQYMKVARVSNLVQTMESLKEAGLWIAGADMDGENIYQANLKGSMGLVMGAEGKGLSPLVREKCDFIISLPMKGPLNSLSVSAAGAVCMYEIMKANS
ncbi:MAG: 23S rRNA (guanosine(2251)-2'-O)-methyltransferase RlmB [Firmicutes bacterium]|nr:23S rRNA (guanosine(2251)-2'-O)-methyltransferase RlmB [Bacillota bacterium]